MSETQQVETTEVTPVVEAEVKATEQVSQEATEPQLSAIEQKAMEMGWRPKADFDGDDEDFIDATEFVRRKPLFDKIEHQSKELKEVKKVLRSLQDHHVKVKEVEFKRALDYLKSQKKEAMETGDTDRVIEIDEQLVDMKAARKAAELQEQEPKQAPPHPDFVAWVDTNKWYAQDAKLRSFADKLGVDYAEENPELPPTEVLKYVAKKVKAAFPEKFKNPNRSQPAAVDGGSPASKPTKASDNFQLSEEEERVMKTFVRAGIMTKDDYIKELKAMRG